MFALTFRSLAPAAALLAACALAVPHAAHAQSDARSPVECQKRIDSLAQQIPDLSETQAPAADLEVSEPHLKAALAALDAARAAKGVSDEGCRQMVDAAAAMLTEGGWEAM